MVAVVLLLRLEGGAQVDECARAADADGVGALERHDAERCEVLEADRAARSGAAAAAVAR